MHKDYGKLIMNNTNKENNMSILYKATTEGDCEGRTTRTLGIFKANSKLQVIEYLVTNNIKPCYDYKVEEIDVLDISDTKITHVADIIEDSYGRIKVVLNAERQAELEKQQLIKSALGKLTDKEILALKGYDTKYK